MEDNRKTYLQMIQSTIERICEHYHYGKQFM